MKWMNSNEWMDMNELKRWTETNELTWTICRPHLQKSKKNSQVFDDFYVKSSSCYSLVRILSTAFRIEAWNRGNRDDPPAATTDGHFTGKTQGFAPERVFSPEFTHSRSLTHPNYLAMMWLKWWCGWHDDWDDDVVAMMVRHLAIDNRP